MIRIPDPQAIAAIIREAALAEILPRFRNLQAHQIREKRPGDLVTEADVEAERVLTRRLTDLLPGSVVIGEEACAHDPTVLDRLDRDEPAWIIDPVDGTSNFAHGRPTFGTIVALASRQRTLAGWIHDPIADVTAIALAGEGAWIGERRLVAAQGVPLREMAGSLGYRKNKDLAASVGRLVRHGSVAHDYLALAEGRIHFAFYRRLNPWDHAAGVLMHAEAGGYAALLDGTPYRPLFSPVGVLLAPNRNDWDMLRGRLEE